MNIYLLGFMASGKTLYGKKLAPALNYSFTDLDDLIEKKENKPVHQIFAQKGEAYFREIEHLVLIESFKLEQHIISLGGGTPCFFDNMAQIKQKGISLFLRVPSVILSSRLYENGNNRPLVRDKTKNELLAYVEKLLEERLPFYQQANVNCDATSLNIQTLVNILRPLL